MEKYVINNGLEIPKIGFGTYKTTDNNDVEIIEKALRQGYKHFDTASFYGNEQCIGEAIKVTGTDREELFLTSKVWKEDMGYDSTLQAFEKSLKNLGTDYLDLYLIHWPKAELFNDAWIELDRQTWKAMEELYKAGKVKAIGLSNFLPHHIISLMEKASIKPMVCQLEFHPGYMQMAAIEFCRKEQILVEAWSPIGRARVLQEQILVEIAEKYKKSPAQLCIRFALQCGVLPLPKSSSRERMKQNLNVFDFEISDYDMYILQTLPQLGWSGEHPDRDRIYV